MRPYLAIIKDSFREALASRVLWILLILTTVLLLAVAPLAIKDHRPARLSGGSVFDWAGLINKLRAAAAAPENSPGKHLWSMLGESVKQELDALPQDVNAEQISPELTTSLLDELNRLIGERGLYDESAWQGLTLDDDAIRFAQRGASKLSDDDLGHLNRRSLEAAFPDEIARTTASEIYLAYFGWKLGDPLAVSRSQVTPFIKSVLAGVMNLFVGTLAVLAGILVTAPVIPHTFEAGAIDLLLSKPVSRWLVFLSKYVGGCAFILLNAAYFVVGLWLIVGLRFDLWSNKLLLCIPIFMFLFAIYYSVSAFAGVLWRNAIVSIVITVLFWAACFVVGTTKNVIEQIFLKPQTIARLVPAKESLFALNDQGKVLLWQDSDRTWTPALQSEGAPDPVGPMMMAPPVLGPVYDARNDQILSVRLPWPGGFSLAAPEAKLLVGARRDRWARTEGVGLPRDPVEILARGDDSVIVVTKQSVFRLEGDVSAKPREFKMLGLRVPLGGDRGPFAAAGPEAPLRLSRPTAAAINRDSGAIAIWNRGTLIVLDQTESGNYQRSFEKEFESEAKQVVLGFGGSTIVIAYSDGRIQLVNARDGNVEHESKPQGKNQPRSIAAAPDGRWFMVVFHHRKTWLWDALRKTEVTPQFTGKSDISAATFIGPDSLLLADRGTRVTEYELNPFRVVRERVPEMKMLERVYRYAILPVYTVFPKPGELDNMVAYLLTEQETAAVDSENLATAQVKLNVKGPVWSSLAFMLVVLALACLYVRRADF
jgi:ABC-type transport system involved in multi-copper enzyme maturation permease subunit